MTTSTYPQLFALLTSPSTDRWNAPYSDKRMAALEEALATMARGEAEGQIPNVRYQEARETISRALEAAWQRLPRPDYQAFNGDPKADALHDAFFGTGLTSTNAKGKLAKIQRLSHPLLVPRIALLEEVAPLAERVTALKAKAVKRAVKTDKERAEAEANRFQVPPSSLRSVEQVRQLLETVVDSQYEQLIQARYQAHTNTMLYFLERQEAAKTEPDLKGKDWHGKPNPDYTPTIHATTRYQGRNRVNGNLVMFLEEVLVKENAIEGTKHWAKGPRAEAHIETLARKEAQELRDQFIYKNLSKIAGILERKGDDELTEAKVVGNRFHLAALEGRLRFSFRDGSSFETTTGLVFVTNQYGTNFYRFPLTFHQVELAGGVKMLSPSEERMHTVFLSPPAPEAAPPLPAPAPPARRRRM